MNPNKRDTIKAAVVKIVAQRNGVSTRQVNRVIQSENVNEKIIEDFLFVDAEINSLANSSPLIKAAADLVPFDDQISND